MSSEFEKSYDTLVEEINSHVEDAIRSLRAALKAANETESIGRLSDFDDWEDLKDAIAPFLPDVVNPENASGWSGSSWCAY